MFTQPNSQPNRAPEPKVRCQILRDCVAGGKDHLKGEVVDLPLNDARLLAIDGRGGAGGVVCTGPPPSVLILSDNI
jgi:hypothetical protein